MLYPKSKEKKLSEEGQEVLYFVILFLISTIVEVELKVG